MSDDGAAASTNDDSLPFRGVGAPQSSTWARRALSLLLLLGIAMLHANTRSIARWVGEVYDGGGATTTTTNVGASRSGGSGGGGAIYPRLAVVTICMPNQELRNHTRILNERYCRVHGCDFLHYEGPYKGRAEGWRDRFRALADAMDVTVGDSESESEGDGDDDDGGGRRRKYDLAMWLVFDAAFVDATVPPHRILRHFGRPAGGGGGGWVWRPDVAVLVSRHHDHPTPSTRLKCSVPLLPQRRYKLRRSVPPVARNVDGDCGVNTGAVVVRNDPTGRILNAEVLDVMSDEPLFGGNEQCAMNVILMRLYQNHGRGQRTVTMSYGEVMNRHVPPLRYSNGCDDSGDRWTLKGFRRRTGKSLGWSRTTSLVLHTWGGRSPGRERFWECAAANGTEHTEQAIVDGCAHLLCDKKN